MWYLSPLVSLYDLLQLGLGHRKGLESNKDEAGQERVVLAQRVDTPDLDKEWEAAGDGMT